MNQSGFRENEQVMIGSRKIKFFQKIEQIVRKVMIGNRDKQTVFDLPPPLTGTRTVKHENNLCDMMRC